MKLAKDPTSKESTKNLAEKLARDLNAKNTETIDPRQDIQHAKNVTAKANTAKDITAKDTDAKDSNGSNSYPLVGPRPEEAPDYDHGTLVMSTGTDGSLVHPLNVMDKTLRSHHLEHDEKDGERNDDQDATITAKDITAKDTGQRTWTTPPTKRD